MLKKQVSACKLLGASLIWFAGCCFSAPLLATSGDLDTSFGSSGKVVSAYGGISMFGPAIKLQADGKIVVAGKHYNGSNDDFAVQRYLSTGALDTGFGTGGTTVFAFSTLDDNAKALAFQTDGKILVGGEGHAASSYGQHALVRLNANGTVDTSFGVGGKVTTDFGLPSHTHAVLVQNDGRIVVVGDVYAGETNGSFAIARYLSNGTLDSSFGSGGKVVQKFGNNSNGHAIAMLSDGKMLIAGYTTNPSTDKDEFIVARYSTSGVIDTSFGANGYSTVAIGLGKNYCHALLLQSDGKIVLLGGALTLNASDFALARFNSNGSLDTSFGSGGIVTTEFTSSGVPSSEETASGALQADGKIVVAGYSSRQFALARYLSTGALDTSFGSGGKTTAKIGTGNDDFIKSLALQADGKVVVVGYSKNAETYNMALARFNNDSVVTQVVEFYNINLDNYFITADSNEAAAIDSGSAGPGWTRTGNSFKSGGNTAVCRFYGSQSPGPNSHFYTVDAAECQGLKDQQIPIGDPRKLTEKSWNLESLDFVSTPPTNGTCPADTTPVYRAYNDGFARGIDSNHRITSNTTAIQEVVTRGWKNESVVMCAPNQ